MTKSPPPPDWYCESLADQERFEAWTNRRLDEMFKPTDADRQRDIDIDNDPKVEADIGGRYWRGAGHDRKRAQIRAAIKRKDRKILAQLDPQLVWATLLPGRGRKKGESRPGDLPWYTRASCELAASDIDRIREIWNRPPPDQGYGRQNRSAAPTAVQIAARRWGLSEETLINFRKNQRRA